jgi:predicted MFS family arabinose efflux permease
MTTSRSFTLLCTVGVFCFISYNMVRMPALALFAESLGASPERIGLIVSVSTLTGVFLSCRQARFPTFTVGDTCCRSAWSPSGSRHFCTPG